MLIDPQPFRVSNDDDDDDDDDDDPVYDGVTQKSDVRSKIRPCSRRSSLLHLAQ